MNEEGLDRPSSYDVVSLYFRIIIAGDSENPQNRMGAVRIFEFPEFPGFPPKYVSGRLRRICVSGFSVCLRTSESLKELRIYYKLIV